MTVCGYGFSHNPGIAMKASLPVRVSEHNYRIASRLGPLFGRNHPSNLGTYPQGREKIARYIINDCAFRLSLATQSHQAELIGSQIYRAVRLLAEIKEIRIRNVGKCRRSLWLFRHHHNL